MNVIVGGTTVSVIAKSVKHILDFAIRYITVKMKIIMMTYLKLFNLVFE